MHGSEHGQGGMRWFGNPPRRGWAEGSCSVRFHGFTFPPAEFPVEKRRSGRRFMLRSSPQRISLLLARRHSSLLPPPDHGGESNSSSVPRRGRHSGSPPWQGGRVVSEQGRRWIPLGCLTQQKPHAFGRQPVAILHAPVVRLGIRQAEFGLVKKQERWLQRLEATRFNGLAAMISALAMSAGLSWKNARFVAAAG